MTETGLSLDVIHEQDKSDNTLAYILSAKMDTPPLFMKYGGATGL
jgi:hypothetical protein